MKQLLLFIVGLLMFLYGIHMMSSSLEKLAINRLRLFLDKMTHSLGKAIFSGIVLSVVLHSSSTLTILIMTFVSSGHMKLKNAIMVIMGANVGTTLSAGLFFIEVHFYVYILLIIGLIFFFRNKYIGQVMIGLSLLLIGLEIMSSSLLVYQNDALLIHVLNQNYHPILLVLTGIVICGVIQSSSACMAILLSFSKSGLLNFSLGAYLLYGFDIGTCLDTSLASIASNKEGRKVAIFHLLFNITGTCLFTLLSLLTPFLSLFEFMHIEIPLMLTFLHTSMNIVTLLLFVIFDDWIIVFLDRYIV